MVTLHLQPIDLFSNVEYLTQGEISSLMATLLHADARLD